MSPLVVLFSVLALAAAKPSGLIGAPLPLAYTAPLAYGYTAPAAAVSHQSRVDISSSPAIVATAAAAPIVRTLYPEPAIVAAPAPVIAAPAAVSHQSRIDIKSSPGIVATELAYTAPLAYGASLAYGAPAAIASPAIIGAPTLIGAPAVPLDTPEVVAARAAHFEAKAHAAGGVHLLKKRSVAPILSTYAAAHLAYNTPLTYGAHLSYNAPLSYHTPLSYNAPLSYNTHLSYNAPLLHGASLAYNTPLSYTSPLAYSTPLISKAYGVQPW